MNGNVFHGKYRGIVTDVGDTLMIGRIKARVPDVYGDGESGWAMPAVPFGGDGMGFFALPKKGAGVWIEFEHGDPDYPIWSGCWFGAASEMPPILLAPPPYKKFLIQTEGGNKVLLDDTPGKGGITLETTGGQKIVMTATGIEITNGQGASIQLSGTKVSINKTALEVLF